MIFKDKKLIFFYFANILSIFFGLILYLIVIGNSDVNLAKLMFSYSVHLILGSILTFGSNLYIFNGLSLLKSEKEKISYIIKNNSLFFKVTILAIFIVIIISILDLLFSPYKKNFGMDLWPLFFAAFLLSLNKIFYFNFLGFKYFKICYQIIILRALTILLIFLIFIFNFNFKFEIIISTSFITAELFIIIFSLKKITSIKLLKINFSNFASIKQMKNSFKLFGDYLFAEIILKVDVFISMLKFELKSITVYLISLLFIEGILTFTIIIRNYFSSKNSYLISNNNFEEYINKFKIFSIYSLVSTIMLIFASIICLTILNFYFANFDTLAFKYFFIMAIGYFFYSLFAASELIFLNRKKYFKQTMYFILALGIQLFFIFILIEDYGIISFPIAISAMFVSMALFILIEILSLNKSSNKVM